MSDKVLELVDEALDSARKLHIDLNNLRSEVDRRTDISSTFKLSLTMLFGKLHAELDSQFKIEDYEDDQRPS